VWAITQSRQSNPQQSLQAFSLPTNYMIGSCYHRLPQQQQQQQQQQAAAEQSEIKGGKLPRGGGDDEEFRVARAGGGACEFVACVHAKKMVKIKKSSETLYR
jgi:hypothetical protein